MIDTAVAWTMSLCFIAGGMKAFFHCGGAALQALRTGQIEGQQGRLAKESDSFGFKRTLLWTAVAAFLGLASIALGIFLFVVLNGYHK
jgi:hypothetical protein